MQNLLIRLLFSCCVALLASGTTALAQTKRIALVIGNAQYSENALRNPINDAKLIAGTLKNDLGFDDVIEKTNLDRRGLADAINELAGKAKGSDSIVVYYSGHGMQSGTGNYLIPVDAKISEVAHIRREGIPADEITDILNDSGARVAILVLDACRDNPFVTRTKSTAKGLARMTVNGGNILVAYATQAGDTADDGEGSNSPYAHSLARHLKRKDLKVLEIFDEVAVDVKRETGKQRPTRYGDLPVNVYLSQVATNATNKSGPDTAAVETLSWQAAQRGDTALSYETYLAEYPNGIYSSTAKINLARLRSVQSRATAPIVATIETKPAPVKDSEDQFWGEVKAAGTKEHFHAYIAQYPKGRYLVFADIELKRIKAQEEAKKRTPEQALWVEVKQSNTSDDYKRYVKRYPTGQCAPLARLLATAPLPESEDELDLTLVDLNGPKGYLAKRSAYFDRDSDQVLREDVSIIQRHSKFLATNPKHNIIIQGNTSGYSGNKGYRLGDRCCSEYQLALGQRRAEAVRTMMICFGVAERQLEAVSFGGEKPKALGNDAAAWAENRRADWFYPHK